MVTDVHVSGNIRKNQLNILIKNLMPTLVVSVGTGIVISSFAFIQHSGLESFIWLICLFIVSIIRYYLVQRYATRLDEEREVEKAHQVFNLGTFIGGVIWGVTPYVLFLDSSTVHKMFLYYVLAGICAASLAAYASSVLAYLSFAGPIILLSSLSLANSGNEMMFVMSMLGLIYLCLLALTSIRMERYVLELLELKSTTSRLERANLTKSVDFKRLNASLNHCQTDMDMARLWSWEVDSELKISSLSRGFQLSTGITPGQVLNRTFHQISTQASGQKSPSLDFDSILRKQQILQELELQLDQPDGSAMTIEINGAPKYDDNGRFAGYRGTGRDITEQKNTLRQLEYYASHDSLTGIVNRRAFYQRLEKMLSDPMPKKGSFYVVYIDLDRLEIVNDTAGHSAGDKLLSQLASELQNSLDDEINLARIGGDEFGLILEKASLETAIDLVKKIVKKVRAFRFLWQEHTFSVGVSVGLVPVFDRRISVPELVRYADHACFVARENKDSGYHIAHTVEGNAEIQGKDTRSVQHMFDALDNDRFALSYQPIASVEDHRICYFETLLGLKDESGDTSSTGPHISVVERIGAMAHFDRWVVRDVLREFSRFEQLLPEAGLFVNLSGSNLDDESIFDFIREQLEKYKVPKQKICFEITETATIGNRNQAIDLIHELKSDGCRFALDDFGTGLASLSYLKDFPVDFVKIDGRFIRKLTSDKVDRAIVGAVAGLSDVMNFKIIAESVEEQDIFPYLAEAGISFVQGYAVGYPQTLEELQHSKAN